MKKAVGLVSEQVEVFLKLVREEPPEEVACKQK